MSTPDDDAARLAATSLPSDAVGLLEGLTTTRAVRRYRDEPVPGEALRAMLFAATRAPRPQSRGGEEADRRWRPADLGLEAP